MQLWVVAEVAEGVETVTGTGAISATVTTTLLSGTEHALPLSATKGAEKVIVNMNNNALTRVLTQPIGLFTPLINFTQILDMVYDSTLNRTYVVGRFGSLEGMANTTGVAYYDFTQNSWKALGGGVTNFTDTSELIQVVTLLGTRVYIGGRFASVKDAGGAAVANTANIAYFDTAANGGLGQWFSVDPTATKFNSTVLNIRSFASLPGQVFIVGNFTSRVAMFNELDGQVTTYNVDTSTSTIRDCLVMNNRLFVCGDFTRLDKTGQVGVVNTKYLAYYDFAATDWFGYDPNAQLNDAALQFTVFQGNVLINGTFTAVGTTLVASIAPLNTIAVLTTTATPTVTQFNPAPLYQTTPGNNRLNRLYVFDNTLWYTTEIFPDQNGVGRT